MTDCSEISHTSTIKQRIFVILQNVTLSKKEMETLYIFAYKNREKTLYTKCVCKKNQDIDTFQKITSNVSEYSAICANLCSRW